MDLRVSRFEVASLLVVEYINVDGDTGWSKRF